MSKQKQHKITTAYFLIACLLIGSSCHNKTDKQYTNTVGNNAAVAAGANGPATFQFALQLKPGAKYYYTINSKTTTALEVENKKVKTSNAATVGLVYEVLKSNGDTIWAKLTYDKLRIVYKTDDEEQVLDADADPESQDEVGKILSSVKGSSLFVSFTKKGSIINVTGSKEIKDKVLAGLSYYDLATKMKVQSQLEKLIGDDFIKGSVGQSFSFYPDGGIAEGATWKRNSTQPGEITFDAATTYTMASVDDKTAVIETTSKLNTGKSSMNISGQKVDADLAGEAEGSFEADVATGMLLKAKNESNMEGTIQVMHKIVPIQITVTKEATVKFL